MPGTVGEGLKQRGVTRREFLKFCTAMTAMLALPPAMASVMAEAISKARRQSVIWLSFQECTGCTESITRSHSPTLENLIFDLISLDYHHTLQAASGEAAEQARIQAMKDNEGKYLLIVDGSIPMGNPGFSTIAGISNYDMLVETAKGAAAIVAVGTCATYGGIPKADPNPTGAVSVSDIVKDKPIINVPGCPPIPVVMTGVLAHFLTFGGIPELDALGRPKSFYGETIHDRCYRRPFYDQGKFAETFDDEAARQWLVSVQARLQGSGDLQRLCDDEVERRHQFPHRVRPRLHRLFRAEFLGCRAALQSIVHAGVGDAFHAGWGGGRWRGCRGGDHLAQPFDQSCGQSGSRNSDGARTEQGGKMSHLDLLTFARGSALNWALIVFAAGIVLRLFEIFGLGRKADLAKPRTD